MNWNTIIAFFRRDYLERATYKSAFFLELGGILANLITFYYIQKLFITAHPAALQPYGGDYFAFVLIGLAFSGYQSTALNSFSTALRQEQMQGTLEAILLTPTRIETVMLAGSIWNFLVTTLKILAHLMLGVVFFHLDLSKMNLLSVIVTLIFTIISLSSLGLFSAGYTLVHQKGDPVNFVINAASRFFSGVYFPITMLPIGLQYVAKIIPLTHALNAMRDSLLRGYSLTQIHSDLLWLILFSLILFPSGIFYFYKSVEKAKKEGTLIFY
ncbi:MAG: ABC transporter permease [Candidatus Omnitrophica bacterium]|nr:ABC transporter permease [Candidatus Omnitrophota bacterium]